MKYLHSDVFLEPLIFNWHAWIGIFNPLSLGFELKNRYLKSLQSYLKSPQRHYDYANNPKFAGGSFINLHPDRRNQVQYLLDKIISSIHNCIDLADEFYKFNTDLQDKNNGLSLQSARDNTPGNLTAFLELVYDLHNTPNCRIIEQLLYKYKYSTAIQSVRISRREQDLRPFVISTPRFEDNNSIIIHKPFNDNIWDEILSAKQKPANIPYFVDKLGITPEKQNLFESLFSSKKETFPLSNKTSTITKYLGHACVLIQSNNFNILIDPLLTTEKRSESIPMHDLPERIDYVLITHAHQDHFSFENLLNLRHRIKNIVIPKNNNGSIADPSMKIALINLGFTNIIEFEELDKITISSNLSITGLPFFGEHGDLDIRSKIGYKVNSIDKSLVFLADSKISKEHYKHALDKNHVIDELFIGMECKGAPFSWAYGSIFLHDISHEQDNSRRLAGSDATDVINFISEYRCNKIKVYAMGMEPWLSHILGINYEEDAIQIKEIKKLNNFCIENGINIEVMKYEFPDYVN